jgi:hypothetical protein
VQRRGTYCGPSCNKESAVFLLVLSAARTHRKTSGACSLPRPSSKPLALPFCASSLTGVPSVCEYRTAVTSPSAVAVLRAPPREGDGDWGDEVEWKRTGRFRRMRWVDVRSILTRGRKHA